MGRKCSVVGCKTGYDSRESNQISVYSFPKQRHELQAWLDCMPNKLSSEKITCHMGVCALHWPCDAPLKRYSRYPTPAVPPSIFPSAEQMSSDNKPNKTPPRKAPPKKAQKVQASLPKPKVVESLLSSGEGTIQELPHLQRSSSTILGSVQAPLAQPKVVIQKLPHLQRSSCTVLGSVQAPLAQPKVVESLLSSGEGTIQELPHLQQSSSTVFGSVQAESQVLRTLLTNGKGTIQDFSPLQSCPPVVLESKGPQSPPQCLEDRIHKDLNTLHDNGELGTTFPRVDGLLYVTEVNIQDFSTSELKKAPQPENGESLLDTEVTDALHVESLGNTQSETDHADDDQHSDSEGSIHSVTIIKHDADNEVDSSTFYPLQLSPEPSGSKFDINEQTEQSAEDDGFRVTVDLNKEVENYTFKSEILNSNKRKRLTPTDCNSNDHVKSEDMKNNSMFGASDTNLNECVDDDDLMFLKSLLPYIKLIPRKSRLGFRARIQSVVEEFAFPENS